MKLLGYSPTELDVRQAVLTMAQKKKQIIHGARATNEQLPVPLRKRTKDYDIYTKNPERSAKELAEELNKRFGKKFKVVEGIHKGTFKVKKGKQTIADYTQVTKHPSTINKFGLEYASKDYAKRKLRGIIRDESKSFRHDKDMETLRRLKEGEKKIW